MTLQKKSTNKFILGAGLILGLIYVLIKVIDHTTSLSPEIEQAGTYLFYLIFLVTIFFVIARFKKLNGNLLKLGEALKTGLSVAVISGLVVGIYILIHRYLIDPTPVDQLVEETRQKLAKNPDMSKNTLDTMMIGVKMGVQPWFTALVWLVMSALLGLVYSLIAGLIMRKEPPNNTTF